MTSISSYDPAEYMSSVVSADPVLRIPSEGYEVRDVSLEVVETTSTSPNEGGGLHTNTLVTVSVGGTRLGQVQVMGDRSEALRLFQHLLGSVAARAKTMAQTMDGPDPGEEPEILRK